ncbi:MAG: DUF4783 domain-containing protein [Bacteroidales bacterium]|nr:DUF4783 domain-containing protein [Bacteroidales bacterium]
MKKVLSILLVLASLLLCEKRAQAQNIDGEFAVFSSITRYLSNGDASSLSSWFADNLDVTVISSSRNCSKKQAREILRNFFNANTPRSFEVTHKASESNKKYLIGQLNAGGELFQVTIYATAANGETYKIQQLNISRQTAVY